MHVQLDSRRADAERQKSYLVRRAPLRLADRQVDSTKRMLDWVYERNAAIIDVNVLPKPPTAGVRPSRDPDRVLERRLAEHVWDTIVECVRRIMSMADLRRLSDARRIVLIGEGVACAAIAALVNTRAVMDRVKAVVMLPGTRRPSEIVGKDKVHGLRQWYYEVRHGSATDADRPALSRAVSDDARARRRHGLEEAAVRS